LETSRAVTGRAGDNTKSLGLDWPHAYTLRRPDKYIAKRVIEWNPQRKHKRGRPQHTWRRTRMAELEEVSSCSIRNEEDCVSE